MPAAVSALAMTSLRAWWRWIIIIISSNPCVGWQVTLCDPIWQVTPRSLAPVVPARILGDEISPLASILGNCSWLVPSSLGLLCRCLAMSLLVGLPLLFQSSGVHTTNKLAGLVLGSYRTGSMNLLFSASKSCIGSNPAFVITSSGNNNIMKLIITSFTKV